MANVKITELTALTDPASTDVLPIVDVVADITKKISIADLLENAGSGTAAAPGIAFDGDSNTGIYRPGADQLAFATNGAQALYINSSGNVGIGTSSPDARLHSRADGDEIRALLYLQNRNGGANAGSQISFSNSTTDLADTRLAYIRSLTSGAGQNGNNLTFGTNLNGGAPTERLRIDSAGNVGIGTSSPDAKLKVQPVSSDIPQSAFGIRQNNAADTTQTTLDVEIDPVNSTARILSNATSSPRIGLYTSNQLALYIDESQLVGIGTSSPVAPLEVARLGSDWTGASPLAGTGIFAHNGNNSATSPTIIQISAGSSSISALSFGDEVTSDVGEIYYDHSIDSMRFNVNSSERLRIDNSGNVGIGTSSPDARLHSRADGDEIKALLYLQNRNGGANAGSQISFSNSTTNLADTRLAYIRSLTSGAGQNGNNLTFGTNLNGGAPTERLRIDSAGNVGIGTSSPGTKLEVDNGNPSGTLPSLGGLLVTNAGTSTSTAVICAATGNGPVFNVMNNGHVGIGTTSPGNKLQIAGSSSSAFGIGLASSNQAATIKFNTGGDLDINQNLAKSLLFSTSNIERARIDSSGRLLVGTSSQSGGSLLQVNDDRIRIASSKTPASASDTGTAGEICWDSSYIYVCTATDTWKRAALSTW